TSIGPSKQEVSLRVFRSSAGLRCFHRFERRHRFGATLCSFLLRSSRRRPYQNLREQDAAARLLRLKFNYFSSVREGEFIPVLVRINFGAQEIREHIF